MAIRSKSAHIAREQNRISLGRRLRTMLVLCLTATALVSSSGCSLVSNARRYFQRAECLNDFMIAHRNKVFASRAWFRERNCYCNQSHLKDFKAGFFQGYADVANGADGCTPVVAPRQYWGWTYQSADGQSAMNAWFAGYPIGAKAAEQDGVGHWSNLGTVGMRLPEPTKPVEETVDGVPAELNHVPMGTEVIVPGSMKTEVLPLEGEDSASLDSVQQVRPDDLTRSVGVSERVINLKENATAEASLPFTFHDPANIATQSANFSLGDAKDQTTAYRSTPIGAAQPLPSNEASVTNQPVVTSGSAGQVAAEHAIPFKFE